MSDAEKLRALAIKLHLDDEEYEQDAQLLRAIATKLDRLHDREWVDQTLAKIAAYDDIQGQRR